MDSIQSIHIKLGFNSQNGLVIYKEGMPLPKSLNRLFEDKILHPHSIFFQGEKPFIFFYNNPTNKEKIFKSIWNFNEVPIVIFSCGNTIDIYNGFEYLKNEKQLSRIGDVKNLNNFEFFKIVSGETWQQYEERLAYKNRVDFKLLENIKAARDRLTTNHNLNGNTANSLIGKCIFIRYLIDRHIRIGFNSSKPRSWSTEEFCEILVSKKKTFSFINYIQEKFNGELFQFDNEAEKIDDKALSVMIDLLKGVDFGTGQINLFDIFDFSIIPVEFISNVYELFIGKKEQARSGVYYTPLFLVEYIIAQTVKSFFLKNTKSYQCKILDPACGSGIFLVESLRMIIERYNEINPHVSNGRGTEEYRKNLRRITEENIFGIDKDESAINVAIFSIYLTLLDYQKPRDIEKFKFPNLLNKNLIVADFFDTQHQFNNKFETVHFDFILGNPPWKRGSGEPGKINYYLDYIRQRKIDEKNKCKDKQRKQIYISNEEIAQAFLLRVSDFSYLDTKAALIVTSKVLYNIKAKKFREYFTENYFIDKVFDLSPVRKEVFDKSQDPSIAPAAIIFFHYAFNSITGQNELEHYSIKPNKFFSLFKLLLIQRNDIKKIKQSFLIEYDWIWKVLLYGNYLDFNFIKRLKASYSPIKKIIKGKSCLVGQGIMVGGGDRNDVSYLLGKNYIETKNDIEPFLVKDTSRKKWNIQFVHRQRNKELFKSPVILSTGGISPEYKAVTAINYENDLVFRSSLIAIRSDDITFLDNVCGCLNSSLFSYYALITFSSVGVERDETHDEEKYSFPYKENGIIAEIVHEIHKIKRIQYEGKTTSKIMTEINDYDSTLNELEMKLNQKIYEVFELNDIEKSLVDYGINYTIPSITKAKGNKYTTKSIKYHDEYLKDYIDVFMSRFSNIFIKNDKRFNVEVWYSKYIIGLFFNVINTKDQSVQNVNWIEKPDTELMKKMASLGHHKVTDKFFIQKDIRGFGKDSFYIFKPNEKKVWHKALAYLDLNDFVDAILKAGSKS